MKDPHCLSETYGLPRLKILEIDEEFMGDQAKSKILAELMSLAPNLQELKLELEPYMVPLMPPGSIRLIKSFCYRTWEEVDADYLRNMKKLSQEKLELRSMKIAKSIYLKEPRRSREFFNNLGLIMSSSRNTLESITVDLPAFDPLAKALQTFGPLESVKELKFRMNEGDFGKRAFLPPLDC